MSNSDVNIMYDDLKHIYILAKRVFTFPFDQLSYMETTTRGESSTETASQL